MERESDLLLKNNKKIKRVCVWKREGAERERVHSVRGEERGERKIMRKKIKIKISYFLNFTKNIIFFKFSYTKISYSLTHLKINFIHQKPTPESLSSAQWSSIWHPNTLNFGTNKLCAHPLFLRQAISQSKANHNFFRTPKCLSIQNSYFIVKKVININIFPLLFVLPQNMTNSC